MKKSEFIKRFLLFFFFMVSTIGCSSRSPEESGAKGTTPVSFSFRVPTNQNPSQKPFAPSPPTISSIKIEVLNNKETVVATNIVDAVPGQTVGVTIKAPSGPDQVVQVLASDDEENPVFQGRSLPENFEGDPVFLTIEWNLLLSPLF